MNSAVMFKGNVEDITGQSNTELTVKGGVIRISSLYESPERTKTNNELVLPA